MAKTKKQHKSADRRVTRVRNKIKLVASKPRLSVARSNKNISAQIIDLDGKIIASASTCGKAFTASGGNKDAAKLIGKEIAEKSIKAGVSEVVFDRGGYLYHGRVAAVAEAARENGLKF